MIDCAKEVCPYITSSDVSCKNIFVWFPSAIEMQSRIFPCWLTIKLIHLQPLCYNNLRLTDLPSVKYICLQRRSSILQHTSFLLYKSTIKKWYVRFIKPCCLQDVQSRLLAVAQGKSSLNETFVEEVILTRAAAGIANRLRLETFKQLCDFIMFYLQGQNLIQILLTFV